MQKELLKRYKMTELELCKNMFIHAAFSNKTSDKTHNEIIEALSLFFDKAIIEKAKKELIQ